MRRHQLEHAIRTACQIIAADEVIVVGSQAILGSIDESLLPRVATLSAEIDIMPIAESMEDTECLADEIEAVAGEFSPFEEMHGFAIDGVDLSTSVLPSVWRDRLVRVQNENTAAPSGQPVFIGWCLAKEDLCVAKLHALREKDQAFVSALLRAELVDAGVIADRLAEVPEGHEMSGRRAREWLTAQVRRA